LNCGEVAARSSRAMVRTVRIVALLLLLPRWELWPLEYCPELLGDIEELPPKPAMPDPRPEIPPPNPDVPWPMPVLLV
jgi:hypothetical protein